VSRHTLEFHVVIVSKYFTQIRCALVGAVCGMHYAVRCGFFILHTPHRPPLLFSGRKLRKNASTTLRALADTHRHKNRTHALRSRSIPQPRCVSPPRLRHAASIRGPNPRRRRSSPALPRVTLRVVPYRERAPPPPSPPPSPPLSLSHNPTRSQTRHRRRERVTQCPVTPPAAGAGRPLTCRPRPSQT
jgi:hypothetical protein